MNLYDTLKKRFIFVRQKPVEIAIFGCFVTRLLPTMDKSGILL
jgi:hypothetical protein